MDIQTLATGMGVVKTATDIVQSLVKSSPTSSPDKEKLLELQSSLISIQQAILDANAQNISLSEQLRELKNKNEDAFSWLQVQNRYKLTEYGRSTFAYELKAQFQTEEPIHKICPHCVQQKNLSVLQFRSVSNGQEWYDCLKCKAEIKLGNYVEDRIENFVAKSDFDVFG